MKIDDKTAFEALQLGAATNAHYDRRIRERKPPYGWYWTSTMAVYEKAGAPLGKTATCQHGSEMWEVAIPKKYQGKRNIVLLANLGKEEAKKQGNGVILTPKKIIAKPMPEKDGWHIPDELGFPSGEEVDSDYEGARKLWRRDESGYVGLLSRGYFGFGHVWRDAFAYNGCDRRYGVIAKTRKCAECGRVCEFDEKWQSFYHAYDFAELLAGQLCKITTFGQETGASASSSRQGEATPPTAGLSAGGGNTGRLANREETQVLAPTPTNRGGNMPEAKKTERNTVGFSLDKDVHAELIKRKKETGKSLHTLVRELVFPAEKKISKPTPKE